VAPGAPVVDDADPLVPVAVPVLEPEVLVELVEDVLEACVVPVDAPVVDVAPVVDAVPVVPSVDVDAEVVAPVPLELDPRVLELDPLEPWPPVVEPMSCPLDALVPEPDVPLVVCWRVLLLPHPSWSAPRIHAIRTARMSSSKPRPVDNVRTTVCGRRASGGLAFPGDFRCLQATVAFAT
jgi:hypothetical protein